MPNNYLLTLKGKSKFRRCVLLLVTAGSEAEAIGRAIREDGCSPEAIKKVVPVGYSKK